MISIIVCSQKKILPDSFIKNIETTIGTGFELIHIDNSENRYSIFVAYNEGISRSKYPFLCFVHDDVLFHTQDWGVRVIEHLKQPEAGIIGVAGGDVVTRIPASWSVFSRSKHLIQSDKTGRKQPELHHEPVGFKGIRRNAILLDGVFLCANRILFDKIRFDEQLTGFHGYDFDITIQSAMSGQKNYIIYDIDLEHLSHGKPDARYYRNLITIYKKWESFLPLFSENLTNENRIKVSSFEKKLLKRLISKMILFRFPKDETYDIATYFNNIIQENRHTQLQNYYLKLSVFFLRIIMIPKLLFNDKY